MVFWLWCFCLRRCIPFLFLRFWIWLILPLWKLWGCSFCSSSLVVWNTYLKRHGVGDFAFLGLPHRAARAVHGTTLWSATFPDPQTRLLDCPWWPLTLCATLQSGDCSRVPGNLSYDHSSQPLSLFYLWNTYSSNIWLPRLISSFSYFVSIFPSMSPFWEISPTLSSKLLLNI